MVKNLRSLIHEYFPLDLRIQFELLSRRRDLVNKEKQEEILKLLRDFNIQGVVPLGPGTNRYAFKINGFVIKVATDHDGKIDNKKEFKMAKRLYPDVTKIYEVSENGTLLVAEYIQPFESYAEMCRYADVIREKLQKISSVYLIGDVGITPNNYANWGLRVGTDDPVCLDFAYVYEVSSELFICKNCKANAMLVPNKDFTKLHCSNPACGKEVLFESIRGRIGNDEHNHEIGDLSKEGYQMYGSNVLTELDESRSNYLARKKDKKKEKVIVEEEPVEVINYTRDSENKLVIKNNSNNKEEQNMSSLMLKTLATKISGGVVKDGVILDATSTIDSEPNERINTNEYYSRNGIFKDQQEYDDYVNDTLHEESLAEEVKSDECKGLAFSGPVMKTTGTTVIEKPATPVPAKETVETNKSETAEGKVIKPEPKTTVVTEEKKTADKSNHVISNDKMNANAENKTKPAKNMRGFSPDFSPRFREFFGGNLSIVAGRISDELHVESLYDEVKENIKDKKMYPESFYKSLKYIIFKSFVTFFQLVSVECENEDGKSYTKHFLPDDVDIMSNDHYPSMIFMDNLYRNGLKQMNCNFAKILDEYRKRLTEDQLALAGGFQEEWLKVLENKLRNGTLKIDPVGIKKICNSIKDLMVVEVKPVEEETATETPAEKEEIVEEPVVDSFDGIMNPPVEDDQEDVMVDHETEPDFTSEEDDAEVEDDSEEEDLDNSYIEIDVIKETESGMDIINIHSNDVFGPISIPIYTNLDNIDLTKRQDSIADNRNGIYDFLIHLCPDFLFTTSNPEYWIEKCNNNGKYDKGPKVAIIENDYEDGMTLMGFYCFDGVYMYTQEDDQSNDNHVFSPELVEDDDVIALINEAIVRNMGFAEISYMARVSQYPGNVVYNEQYLMTLFDETAKELGIDETEEDDDAEESEGLEDVAAAVILGNEPAEEKDCVCDDLKTAGFNLENEDDHQDGVMEVMRRRK